MTINYRIAQASDTKRCLQIRGMTRQNPMTLQDLQSIGVTQESWASAVATGEITGTVAESEGCVVGYCFGDFASGEIQVLALLPAFENKGIGKVLLSKTMAVLFASGLTRLWLAASPDPAIRAHGFYRYLGWQYTGETDRIGDQILEYKQS